MAAPRGSAIIELPDDEAFVREDLVPGQSGPMVHDILRAGSAIHDYDCRIFFSGLKTGGFDHAAIQQRAIGCLYLDDLSGKDVELIGWAGRRSTKWAGCISIITIRFVERSLARAAQAAVVIRIVSGVGSHRNHVGA